MHCYPHINNIFSLSFTAQSHLLCWLLQTSGCFALGSDDDDDEHCFYPFFDILNYDDGERCFIQIFNILNDDDNDDDEHC